MPLRETSNRFGFLRYSVADADSHQNPELDVESQFRWRLAVRCGHDGVPVRQGSRGLYLMSLRAFCGGCIPIRLGFLQGLALAKNVSVVFWKLGPMYEY